MLTGTSPTWSTTLIELFAPLASLTDARREELGERLVTELVNAPGAPADLIDRGRALTQLVIHEPAVWTVGGRPVSERPRYIVRVSVPGGHLTDGMRAEMVTRITRVLAENDSEPERFYEDTDAWVHINEVPDGNIGAFGQIVSTADVTNFVVKGTRPMRQATTDDNDVATLIDPICGMTVALTDTAITVEHDGRVHAFCAPGCRDIFMARHGVEASGPGSGASQDTRLA